MACDMPQSGFPLVGAPDLLPGGRCIWQAIEDMRPLPDAVLSFTPIRDALGDFFILGVHAARLTRSQPMHEKAQPLPPGKLPCIESFR
jgi:hypothetical protein